MSADTGDKPKPGSNPGPNLGSVDAMGETIDPRVTPTELGVTGDGAPEKSMPVNNTSEIVGAMLSGRYLVTKKVGQGGMGAVYEATHTLIGKRVAVKVLLEKYAQREQIVARLKKEAQLASSIGNEHIIDITDIGNTDDGRTFVVMEYLEGESLAECLAREHELPEQRILRIASQAASALSAAHAKGIVHRDIKPENLFLLKRKEQDFVKVVDFGISKSLRATGEEEEQQRLTQTGMVLGTPLYMSPEQARGDEDLDHRVDVYALGVIMYETAAGRVPFAGTNYLSVISQVLNEQPKPLREIRPELSEEFEAIVQKAMAKDRNDRYVDAEAMQRDVTALLEDPSHSTERAKITGPRRRLPVPPKIPRIAWAIGAIGVTIGVVTIAVVMLMNSGDKHKAMAKKDAGTTQVVQPPPPVVDAFVEPEVEKITITIVTDPIGAEVFRESEDIGPSPQTIPLVKTNKEVHITAQKDGYVDGISVINPEERKDGQTVKISLKKLPKGAPQQHVIPATGSGSGSAQKHSGTAGGELNGYPGQQQ
ncbi:MAG TPA: serine/threonine-protein kinase [Kofleriaceae bacterium]